MRVSFTPVIASNQKLVTFFSLLFLLMASNSFATIKTSTAGGGNWNATTTWTGSVVPVAADTVIIAGPVTANVTATVAMLTVNSSGTLQYANAAAYILTVNGSVIINTGGTITVTGPLFKGHTLSIGGDFTNNGTFNGFSSSLLDGIKLIFKGSTNSSFTSSAGSVTNIYMISLAKTAAALVVDFNPGNAFTAAGPAFDGFSGFLNLAASVGIFKVSGNTTLSNEFIGFTTGAGSVVLAYTIGASAGFWVANPNATVIGQAAAAATVSGTLQVDAGVYNIGATTEGITFGPNSKIIVNGGTIAAKGRFGVSAAGNAITYTQTGGTVYTNTNTGNTGLLASFDAGTATGTVFNMSGGNIVLVQKATTLDYRGPATGATSTITGGTVLLGTAAVASPVVLAATAASTVFNITAVAPNLVVDQPGIAGVGAIQLTAVTIKGDLSLYGPGSYNKGNFGLTMAGMSATNPGNITVSGAATLTLNGSATAATGLFFTSTYGNQAFSLGAGAITSSELPSVTINNTYASGTVSIPAGLSLMSASTLTLTAGLLDAGASVKFGSDITAGTFTCIRTAGSITAASASFGTAVTTKTYTYNGAGAISTGAELTTTSPALIDVLTITNASLNLTLDKKVTVNTTFTLTNGLVSTSNTNLLILNSTASVAGGSAASYVNGPVARNYVSNRTAVGTYTALTILPAGKAGLYLPVHIDPSTNSGGSVQIQAEAFTSNPGTNATPLGTLSANRWEASAVVGAANLVSVRMRQNDAVVASNNKILIASSAAGIYGSIIPISTYAAGAPNTLTTATALTLAEFSKGVFAYGDACQVSAIPITGNLGICAGNTFTMLDPETGSWSTSDASIASISGAGLVTGVAPGSATISFTVASADICNLVVLNKIITISNCSGTPGGVGNNLISWFKGDAGLSAGAWDDQLGSNNLVAAGAPAVSGMLNFTPVATLGGIADYYGNANAEGWLANANATTYYYVAKSAGTGIRVVYGRGVASAATTSMHGGRRTTNNSIFASGTTSASITPIVSTTNPIWTTNPVSLSRSGYDGANYYVNANGSAEALAVQAGVSIPGIAPFYIGRAATSGSFWQGDVAEVIAYNGKHSATDYNRIESYLAFKYGITFSPVADYLASDGTTKMWTAAAATAGFNNDLFGIGKDAASGLDQKVSASVSSDNILTVATTNNFALVNTDPSRTSLSNLNFETITNNNGAATWTTTGSIPNYKILTRQWQVQETGTIGTVYLQLDTANAAFAVPARGMTALPYYIITDPNADGDYSDGTLTPLTNTSGSLWSAGIDFTDKMNFTIATGFISIGPDNFVCGSIAHTYTLTGVGPLPGNWIASAANPAGVALSSTVGGVATADFTSAPAAVYYFNYTIGSSSKTIAITYSDCKSPGGVAANIWQWTRADAGITAVGGQVSKWTNQTQTTMVSQASKTASSHVTLVNNGINYNPVVKFDGTNSEVLFGFFGAVPPFPNTNSNIFVVTMPTANNGGTGELGAIANPYSVAPEGSIGIQYNNSTFQVDGAGAYGPTLSATSSQLNEVSLIRENYVNDNTTNGAVMSKNGLPMWTTPDYYPLPNYTTGSGFEIGGRTYGGQPSRVFPGYIAEIAHYNGNSLTATQVSQVESYFALKYGITLDNSLGGSAGDYLLSDGTTAWSAAANAAYHHQVIGIVRDTASTLLQKQSHTTDDSLRVFMGALAADNISNTSSISNNLSSIVIGNDGGLLGSVAGQTKPVTIFSRLNRIWKVTNTNFTDNFGIEIKWDSTGPFYISDLRLLVSDSPDFTNAAVYSSYDVNFYIGSIIVTGISNAVIPVNSTKYISIGSASLLTPLTVNLVNFNASVIDNKQVKLDWQTSSETSNAYFTIERSSTGNSWEMVNTINGANNSTGTRNYSSMDKNPYSGTSYYRLKITDNNGQSVYSAVRTVKLVNTLNNTLAVYPNPASSKISINGKATELKTLKLFNAAGQDVTKSASIIENSVTGITLDISRLSNGIYTLKTNTTVTKISKQ